MTIESELSAMLLVKRPIFNKEANKWIVKYIENEKTLSKEFTSKEDSLVFYYQKLHEIEDIIDKNQGRTRK